MEPDPLDDVDRRLDELLDRLGWQQDIADALARLPTVPDGLAAIYAAAEQPAWWQCRRPPGGRARRLRLGDETASDRPPGCHRSAG